MGARKASFLFLGSYPTGGSHFGLAFRVSTLDGGNGGGGNGGGGNGGERSDGTARKSQ